MDPIHQEGGRWYFWDETWSERIGPYNTHEDAATALARYCKEVL